VVTGIVVAVLLTALVVTILWVVIARSQHLLRMWAAENGYELLHADFRPFRKGPYFWSGRNQTVFRVEVRDREGRTRSGWVRCGSWWAGVFGEHVEGQLDD